eukprot:9476020-Pyramimonas_sp.AAC.1
MSHPVPSLPEQSEHEILIPLAPYPDSQKKDWLSAEPRDVVEAGSYQPEAGTSDEPCDLVAAGMSYDKTDDISVTSRSADHCVVQRDGHDINERGPGQGRIPPSNIAIATRVSRGKSAEGVVEMSVDVSPSGTPIGNREQTPDPYGRTSTTARPRRSAFLSWSAKSTESVRPIPNATHTIVPAT